MALGLNLEEKTGGGGKFLPMVQWSAKSGDFIAVNREPQPDGTWDKHEVEIELPARFVVDLERMEVGWFSIEGGKPLGAFVDIGQKMPAQPGSKSRQAVRLRMFFKEHGLREFTTNAVSVLRIIDQLHNEYVEQAPKNAGKMPVVTITGRDTIKVQTPEGEQKFKVPKMELSGWAPPPPAFEEWRQQASAPKPPEEKPASKPAQKPVDDDLEF